jgi:hypothetical protein
MHFDWPIWEFSWKWPNMRALQPLKQFMNPLFSRRKKKISEKFSNVKENSNEEGLLTWAEIDATGSEIRRGYWSRLYQWKICPLGFNNHCRDHPKRSPGNRADQRTHAKPTLAVRTDHLELGVLSQTLNPLSTHPWLWYHKLTQVIVMMQYSVIMKMKSIMKDRERRWWE